MNGAHFLSMSRRCDESIRTDERFLFGFSAITNKSSL